MENRERNVLFLSAIRISNHLAEHKSPKPSISSRVEPIRHIHTYYTYLQLSDSASSQADPLAVERPEKRIEF